MPFLCGAFVYRSLMYMRCFVSKCHIPTYRAVFYNRSAVRFLVTCYNISYCPIALYYRCGLRPFVGVSISCLLFGCCGTIFLYRVFEQLMLDEVSYKKHYYNYSKSAWHCQAVF